MDRVWLILLSLLGILVSNCSHTSNESANDLIKDRLDNSMDSIAKQPVTSVPKPLFETVPAGMYRSLNAKLATAKQATPEQIIKMYYPATIAKANSYEKIDVHTEQKGKQTIVTLTHDNQSQHIAIQGHRLIMTLEKQNNKWQIVALKQQFKCWARNNKIVWGTEKCS